MANATGQTGGVRRAGPALIRWQHSSGGSAYCLARLVAPPAPERPTIVLSEVAGNPDAVGLVSDFAGAVPAALAALGQGLDPQSVRWLAHHGDFSSYDAADAPETFSEVGACAAAGTTVACERRTTGGWPSSSRPFAVSL